MIGPSFTGSFFKRERNSGIQFYPFGRFGKGFPVTKERASRIQKLLGYCLEWMLAGLTLASIYFGPVKQDLNGMMQSLPFAFLPYLILISWAMLNRNQRISQNQK
jgi:uncharacterized membrane protein YwaF